MRLFTKCKDGGPDSPVDGYFLIEVKGLFSIALLKFNKGMREKYHSHAFSALTWFIKGDMREEKLDVLGVKITPYKRSLLPKYTHKSDLHRVRAWEDSWCITLRGPWDDTWQEYDEETNQFVTLTHGRVEVE